MSKHGPTTEAGRRHLSIQTERAMYVKALIAEGKTDDEIIAILIVDENMARSFLSYGRNY